MLTDLESSMTEEKQNLIPTMKVEMAPENEEMHPLNGNKIEIRDFSFYYGKFKALGNINLYLPANQVTAIIGPSGCGNPPCCDRLTA